MRVDLRRGRGICFTKIKKNDTPIELIVLEVGGRSGEKTAHFEVRGVPGIQELDITAGQDDTYIADDAIGVTVSRNTTRSGRHIPLLITHMDGYTYSVKGYNPK